jgi:hypothetical protein
MLLGSYLRGFKPFVAAASLVSVAWSALDSSTALAWGNLGHRIVGGVAAEVASDGRLFWQANESSIATFANTPDVMWKRGESSGLEKPTHWFHFDHYSEGLSPLPTLFEVFEEVVRQYGNATVEDNGTGIWRVEQFYINAREQLKAGRYDQALQYAGAMAHYVGDLAQPLHVTQNYDGQLTNQTGIHAFFETANLESIDSASLREEVVARASALVADPQFVAQFEKSIMHAMLMQAQRSVQHAGSILSIDRDLGRGEKASEQQLEIAKERLADGAASYSLLLNRLWREGGQKDSARTLRPAQPKWISPNYSNRAFGERFSGAVAQERGILSSESACF